MKGSAVSQPASTLHAAQRWSVLVVITCTLAALAVVGSAVLHLRQFPLDDSWIHQTVAKNFAQFGSLGYLPHQRSSGSTSLLWTLVLALRYRLLPVLAPPLYSAAVCAVLLAGTGYLLLQLALRDGMPRWMALLWSVAPLGDGNFVWLAFIGMEHLLFVFLSVLSLALWTEPRRPAWLAGMAMGLLAMTRPEGAVLWILLLAVPALVHRTRPQALRALVPAALLTAIPFAINLRTSHTLLPLTYKGRLWLYMGGAHPSLARRLQLLPAWFHRVLASVQAPAAGATTGAQRFEAIALSLLLLAGAGVGLLMLVRRRYGFTLMLCTWGLLHSCLYIFVLPNPGHGGRYQPFLLLLLFPLLTLGVIEILGWAGMESRRQCAVATGVLVVLAAFSLGLWRKTLFSGVSHIEMSHARMGQWLSGHLPGQTVAVFDIGRIGFLYQGHIVDLGGLTDAAYTPYLLQGRVPVYLQQHGITLVVLPTELDGSSRVADSLRLQDSPSMQLEPLFRACTPSARWQLGYLLTSNALPCQALYRIHYLP